MPQPKYKDRYRVESTRLPHRDYGANGWYFVTICTHNRQPHFGNVTNGAMALSPIGQIAQQFWTEIPQHHTHVGLDVYVVMPNHLHGIVIIDRPKDIDPQNPVGSTTTPDTDIATQNHNGSTTKPITVVETLDSNVSTRRRTQPRSNGNTMSAISPKAGTLATIVRSYKSSVTRWCRKNDRGYFAWQPRYYDHIIRADGSLDLIREYIAHNPTKWADDQENPGNLWM